jgi:hypothetical protein
MIGHHARSQVRWRTVKFTILDCLASSARPRVFAGASWPLAGAAAASGWVIVVGGLVRRGDLRREAAAAAAAAADRGEPATAVGYELGQYTTEGEVLLLAAEAAAEKAE